MSLTLGRHRPLSSTGPATVNYEVDGPQHRLLFDPFPRRIRAFYGGELVLDSVRAMLLHESNLMVVLYLPREDVLATMTPTEHTTHCPFKGHASYWDVEAGGQMASNAAWGYLEPQPEASWLAGYVAFYWDAMDAWFDEDEETGAHPRDPYTRIDVRCTSRPVEVSVRGEVVAETRRALVLSEGHLPNRFYVPRRDVPQELLEVSPTHTYCPYKGKASYLHVAGVRDGAWHYPEPYDGVTLIRHRSDGPSGGFVVDVVVVFFTPHLDYWEAFFQRLGFTAAATAPGWNELRAGTDSGVIGLHASETTPSSPNRYGLSFKTSEPLHEFVARMRALGYDVTEEPEAQAPHVTVTDPDGIPIEIHQR